jgi:hypothetical protein
METIEYKIGQNIKEINSEIRGLRYRKDDLKIRTEAKIEEIDKRIESLEAIVHDLEKIVKESEESNDIKN